MPLFGRHPIAVDDRQVTLRGQDGAKRGVLAQTESDVHRARALQVRACLIVPAQVNQRPAVPRHQGRVFARRRGVQFHAHFHRTPDKRR